MSEETGAGTAGQEAAAVPPAPPAIPNFPDLHGTPEQISALVTAICAARTAIGDLEKSGYNSQFNYSYVKASDLYGAVGLALVAQQVIPSVSILEQRVRATKTPGGKDTNETMVKVAIMFIHKDGGRLTQIFYGVAQDNADKGLFKAYTGAVKYGLMQTLLIGGDDPDSDRGQGTGGNRQGQGQQSRPPYQSRPAPPPQGAGQQRPTPPPQQSQRPAAPPQESAPPQPPPQQAPPQGSAAPSTKDEIISALTQAGFKQVASEVDLKGNTFMVDGNRLRSISFKKTLLEGMGFVFDRELKGLVKNL